MARLINLSEKKTVTVPIKLINTEEFNNDAKMFVLKLYANENTYDKKEFEALPNSVKKEIDEIIDRLDRGEM